MDAPRLRLANVMVMLALFPALATLLGLLGSWYWAFDLCANFPLHCFLLLLPAGAALLLLRSFATGSAVLGTAAIDAVLLWPLFFGAPPAPPADGAPLAVMSINLLSLNDSHDQVLAAVRARDPDLLVCSELTPEWHRVLRTLEARLPHVLARPEHGTFGIGVYSKLPLGDAAVIALGYDWSPAVRATLATPRGALGILAVHAPRPGLDGRRCAERDTGLRAIPDALAPLPPLRMVIGDLNSTPWNAAFRRLLDATGLQDTAPGQGWQATWHTRLPSFLRIPIDHLLVSPGIGLRRRGVGPHIGSDHLPLWAELSVSSPPPADAGNR